MGVLKDIKSGGVGFGDAYKMMKKFNFEMLLYITLTFLVVLSWYLVFFMYYPFNERFQLNDTPIVTIICGCLT
ncbi:hypothetical protein CO704_04140 [Cedecea neteri]|uniref:Uncharacterized protein n=1 Tax=Cedecea neteri TaxID=158822 RepID=A0A291DUC5_9ENTR|nr:hypothetical protein CO704_04140 [Cedecea neteri]